MTHPFLNIKQVIIAVVHASVFPLTNLMGGNIAFFGILATLPFLPIAWIGGMAAVSFAGKEAAYLFGASIAVLAQVLLIMVGWSESQRRRNTKART